MDPDLSAVDARLDALDADGYLLDADGTDPNQQYLSGFDAPDPFVTLYAGGTHLLFVRSLEFGRAKRDARADTVERFVDFAYDQRLEEHGRREAAAQVRAAFLRDHDVESVAVPPRFPTGTADALREQGIEVVVDHDDAIEQARAVKTDEEIEHVRAAQRANERAMAAAEDLIRGAGVDDEGRLVHEGEVLTSERVREEIEVTLLRDGCALDETIVACGADAADPHDQGSGPLLAEEPIILDIFPRDKATKYHADMTRTFLVGEPSETIEEWFELTDRARKAAIDAVEPGVTGAEVHDAVCDVYEDAGLPTLRSDGSTETGFIHTTGHGVGLAVHEQPSVSQRGGELEPGHVITIEPGLYDPDVGGVRIEDFLVVTEDGAENLTEYPVELTAE
ncbi:X-pro aminopeptidase protein [Halorhabdus tiamatea SARL4B]|uniref:X-pro aminopeptidase protein n=1 Tax=Halorhabdus tiamatea SARL4B TaxID=1033806 RepID=S6D288_9EURY|nr:Xaa-Pro peptidase family protein [Halorhabdus tiamatea]ERJ07024.1 X-pro aminopeptidase protein [Halorhabdus tiamatea SARL4B]CCQ34793.1 Xaa-Pro aminopeptidase (M24) [Halorhabdus tiamatea SARL4B]